MEDDGCRQWLSGRANFLSKNKNSDNFKEYPNNLPVVCAAAAAAAAAAVAAVASAVTAAALLGQSSVVGHAYGG